MASLTAGIITAAMDFFSTETADSIYTQIQLDQPRWIVVAFLSINSTRGRNAK